MRLEFALVQAAESNQFEIYGNKTAYINNLILLYIIYYCFIIVQIHQINIFIISMSYYK